MSGTGRSPLLALLAFALLPAAAVAQDEPVKERDVPGPPRTPLEQAREEAGEPARAPTRYRAVRVRLSSRARRALRRARTVRLTARATVDARDVLSRRVTLQR